MADVVNLDELSQELDAKWAALRDGIDSFQTALSEIKDTKCVPEQIEITDQRTINEAEQLVTQNIDRLVQETGATGLEAIRGAYQSAHEGTVKAMEFQSHSSERWVDLINEFLAASGGLDEELGRQQESFAENWSKMADTVSGLVEQSKDTGGRVGEVFESFSGTVEQDLTQQLMEKTSEFLSALDEQSSSVVPSNYERIMADMEGRQFEFENTSNARIDQLVGEIGDLVGDLGEYTQEEATNRFAATCNGLVEDTLQGLISECAESVAQTGVGASVSTAMTPVLPQMAALYKATEMIKVATDAFKSVKSIF